MSRKLVFAILGWLLLVLLTARLGYLFFSEKPRLDSETFEKIRRGMSEEQLISLIGCRPGDYGGPPIADIFHEDFVRPPKGFSKELLWRTADKGIVVWLDVDGKVRAKSAHVVFRREESFFDAFRRSIGIQPASIRE